MGLAKEKRGHSLYRLFWPNWIFLRFVFYLSVLYWIHFQNIHIFRYQKTIQFCCLFLKSPKAFSVSLSFFTSSLQLINLKLLHLQYIEIYLKITLLMHSSFQLRLVVYILRKRGQNEEKNKNPSSKFTLTTFKFRLLLKL